MTSVGPERSDRLHQAFTESAGSRFVNVAPALGTVRAGHESIALFCLSGKHDAPALDRAGALLVYAEC